MLDARIACLPCLAAGQSRGNGAKKTCAATWRDQTQFLGELILMQNFALWRFRGRGTFNLSFASLSHITPSRPYNSVLCSGQRLRERVERLGGASRQGVRLLDPAFQLVLWEGTACAFEGEQLCKVCKMCRRIRIIWSRGNKYVEKSHVQQLETLARRTRGKRDLFDSAKR